MAKRRVVVTGMAGFSPIGNEWDEIHARLIARRSGIRYLPEWGKYNGLLTRLGAPVNNFQLPAHYTRKNTRSMGRVSLKATRVTELALIDAGLLNDPVVIAGLQGLRMVLQWVRIRLLLFSGVC